MAGRIGVVVFAVFEVEVAERVAMDAVDGEQDHDGEVGDEQRRVKRVPVIEALEGLVCGLHCFEVVDETVLGGEGEKRGEPRGQRPEEDAGEAGNGIQKGHKRGEQGRTSTDPIGTIVCDAGIGRGDWRVGRGDLPITANSMGASGSQTSRETRAKLVTGF